MQKKVEKPPTPPPINLEYLLAEMRCARLRAQLIQNEIDAIGIALDRGMITADQAMQCLQEVGLARWIGPAGSTWNDGTEE